MKDEIGIEREYFLLKNGKIVEPTVYGFPFDEFGFLVEIRTQPHTTQASLMKDFLKLLTGHTAQAKSLGLELKLVHRMRLSQSFVNYLRKKYVWDYLTDTTANVYSGIEASHATGIDQGRKIIRGTAGLHIHFSRKRGLRRVQLPLKDIVLAFDARFNHEIALAHRIHGEYEIKPYGFEYRSLPTTINLLVAINFGFILLERNKNGLGMG